MKWRKYTCTFYMALHLFLYVFVCYMKGVAVVHCLPKCSVSEFTNISGMVEFI